MALHYTSTWNQHGLNIAKEDLFFHLHMIQWSLNLSLLHTISSTSKECGDIWAVCLSRNHSRTQLRLEKAPFCLYIITTYAVYWEVHIYLERSLSGKGDVHHCHPQLFPPQASQRKPSGLENNSEISIELASPLLNNQCCEVLSEFPSCHSYFWICLCI